MPRVHQHRARKDYPEAGIKKGQKYYLWKLKTGPRSSQIHRSLRPPKPEDLTTSPYYKALYPLGREIANFEGSEGDLEDLVNRVRDLGEEQQEKFDNLPPGFQEGPTGELLQERADECEDLADRLYELWDEFQSAQTEEEIDIIREGIRGESI